MKCKLLIISFALVVHVKCQLDVHIDELLYEEDEEDDNEGASTSTTTTKTTTRVPAAAGVGFNSSNPNTTSYSNGTLNANATRMNATFEWKPTNNSIFTGAVTSLLANTGASTERVHYVLNQVGGIFNNVGTLNITGIVDQALGIRNSQIARPIVTGILNAVFCNPFTFSENNCQRRGSG